MFASYIPIILSTASLVAAHGYLNEVLINGESFKANYVGSKDLNSIVRPVTSQDPMKGSDNKDLACGPGSSPAKSMASVKPGDSLEFSWTGQDGSAWPHEVGPMITYMGYCGKGGLKDCSEVDSTTVKWFKIDEAGTSSDGKWWVEELMSYQKARVTIPDDLAAGNYLIRHELIALHLATEYYGAEFYSGCAQLKVGGSGSKLPADDDLLLFPGAYKDDDQGIYTPNVFNPGNKYEFPGGPVAKLVESGGNSGSDDDDEAPETGIHLGTGSCRLKKKSTTQKRTSYFPRHRSRIMRDLVSSQH